MRLRTGAFEKGEGDEAGGRAGVKDFTDARSASLPSGVVRGAVLVGNRCAVMKCLE
jgi:hypothetical protein